MKLVPGHALLLYIKKKRYFRLHLSI